MILVTDEDRDGNSSANLQDTVNPLIDNDVSLHMVLNQKLVLSDAIGVTNPLSSENTTVVVPVSSGDFETIETSGQVLAGGFGETKADYVSLTEATAGSVWDISKVRRGGLAAGAFRLAFPSTVLLYIQEALAAGA